MSEPNAEFNPYRVEYSARVREKLLEFATTCRSRGDGAEFVAALKEFDRRLRIYPQFGEPLMDLRGASGQIWIGIVRPLTMRYGLYDDLRAVMVSASPVLMPMSKSNDDS